MRREEEEETEKESALPYLPCKLHLKVAAAAFYLSRFLANNEKKKERELLMPHCHIHAMAIFGSEFFSIPELSQK